MWRPWSRFAGPSDMSRAILLGSILLLLAACSSETDSGEENGYASLVGPWVSLPDSGFGLEITQVCCGPRSRVKGSITLDGEELPFGPASSVNDYTVILPDSASSVTHIVVLKLDLHPEEDGDLCRLEGMAESEGDGYSGSLPLSVSALRLFRWVQTPTGCEATGESLEWVKAR